MIDGVRINPGTIGLPALQNIPPDTIERIEVVKGPRSALWGTDAIGGVINVVTRRGSRDGWTAEVGYGDYETRKAAVNGGFGITDRPLSISACRGSTAKVSRRAPPTTPIEGTRT